MTAISFRRDPGSFYLLLKIYHFLQVSWFGSLFKSQSQSFHNEGTQSQLETLWGSLD